MGGMSGVRHRIEKSEAWNKNELKKEKGNFEGVNNFRRREKRRTSVLSGKEIIKKGDRRWEEERVRSRYEGKEGRKL